MDSTSASRDDWESQLIEYSVGTMGAEDASRFEQALEECQARVRLASEYNQMMGLLASTVQPVAPPQGHKARFMARIAAIPQQGPAPELAAAPENDISASLPQLPQAAPGGATVSDLQAYRERRSARFAIPAMPALVAAAAAIVLLIGISAWYFSQLSQVNSQLDAWRNVTLSLPAGSRSVRLDGKNEGASAQAVAFVNPDNNQTVLVVSGLNPLPSDKIYEMWLLQPQQGAKPLPAGTFNSDTSGHAYHSFTAPSNLSQYAGLAVTLEPAPGGPEARGDIVLVGTYTNP